MAIQYTVFEPYDQSVPDAGASEEDIQNLPHACCGQ
jgi:hypothetical protein